MIAYEDLVVALSSWRAGQGLPPNSVHFTSSTSGSVDLALPSADPIEALSTGEIEALDDDLVGDDEYALDEYASKNDDHDYAAPMSDHDASEAEVIEESDAELLVSDSLDYGDDESEQTAIASDFEGARPRSLDAAPMPPALAPAEVEESDGDEIAVDDMHVEEIVAAAGDFQAEPHTEEVEMLGEEFPDEAADEQEGPTKFGDIEAESTVMGIGIDELRGPGPGKDSE